MYNLSTVTTPRGRKIHSARDQQGKYYYCFSEICSAFGIDPDCARHKLSNTSYVVSLPIKVHKNRSWAKFMTAEAFPILGKALNKPEAIQLLEYMRQRTETSAQNTNINNVVLECMPIIRLMVDLRKFRDNVADVFYTINGRDSDMESAKDYINAQEHIALAINDLGKVASDVMSEYVNYY